MKKGRNVIFAALFVVLTGCATTSVSDQGLSPLSGADSIAQKTEFKDLPAEMQQEIVQGG